MSSDAPITIADIINLLIEEDSQKKLWDGLQIEGLKDSLDGRPSSLREIQQRNYESFAELQDDVETLLYHAVSQGKGDAVLRATVKEMYKTLRQAADVFSLDDTNSHNTHAPKYVLRDGDSFEDQKVALARRNADGSLLFTNAYSGPIPEDFFRVAELDDQLTPVYINPTLELNKMQVPRLGSLAKYDSKIYRKRREDVVVNAAVTFLEYNPYQSFAPQTDSTYSLMSIKETIQLLKRRKPSSKSSQKIKKARLEGFSAFEGAQFSVEATSKELLEAAVDTASPQHSTLLNDGLLKLSKIQETSALKGTPLSEEDLKLAEKVGNAFVHSMLTSDQAIVSTEAAKIASSIASARRLEPVFKGMLPKRI
ncbi:hypothetical protein HDU77_005857 [Chytriomyces hyalinus]|nr:hypothetical protein HDU77_005857 [Chytriomyces hyalinus]